MNTRSYVSSRAFAVRSAASTPSRRTCAISGSSSSAARFAFSAFTAAPSRSTNTAAAAPRDSASMPSPPAPAKRSSTLVPSSSPSSPNSDSRTRSEVGRVTVPLGAVKRRPPRRPAMTRMLTTLGRDRLERLAAEAALQSVCEQGVLGLSQLGVGRHDRLGTCPRALEQPSILRQAGDLELGQARLAGAPPLALLAQRQVGLREPKAVGVLDHRAQPRRARRARSHEEAAAGMLAAAYPPAQLV